MRLRYRGLWFRSPPDHTWPPQFTFQMLRLWMQSPMSVLFSRMILGARISSIVHNWRSCWEMESHLDLLSRWSTVSWALCAVTLNWGNLRGYPSCLSTLLLWLLTQHAAIDSNPFYSIHNLRISLDPVHPSPIGNKTGEPAPLQVSSCFMSRTASRIWAPGKHCGSIGRSRMPPCHCNPWQLREQLLF